jgi:hypothetical protein
MDTSPVFLSGKYNVLDLDLSSVGESATVKLKKIDNLHEARINNGIANSDWVVICGECFMPAPCATHLIIHDEERDTCVHWI